MDRDSEARLIDFCACQFDAFQESAWLENESVSRRELAAACLFLAGVDWYRNDEALLRLAQILVPGCQTSPAEFLRETRFDCLRFSNQLRRELRHAYAAP